MSKHGNKSGGGGGGALHSSKLELQHYFRETTIHGFRYLVDERNICEIVVWLMIIIFGLFMTGLMLYQSFYDSYYDPILTRVKTTTIQKVQ